MKQIDSSEPLELSSVAAQGAEQSTEPECPFDPLLATSTQSLTSLALPFSVAVACAAKHPDLPVRYCAWRLCNWQ